MLQCPQTHFPLCRVGSGNETTLLTMPSCANFESSAQKPPILLRIKGISIQVTWRGDNEVGMATFKDSGIE